MIHTHGKRADLEVPHLLALADTMCLLQISTAAFVGKLKLM